MNAIHPHYECKIITLKKVKHEKLSIINDALVHYCSTIAHDKMQFLEHHVLSLAAKMSQDMLPKINKHPAPKKHNLKLEYFKAHLLHLAFNDYLKALTDQSHEKAVITNLNFEIYKQLI